MNRLCSDGKTRGTGRPPTPETNCMTPDCPFKYGGVQSKKGRGARGLCKSCHNVASNLVRKGITTWEELEKLGLCQPPYRTLFEKAFKEAKSKSKEIK